MKNKKINHQKILIILCLFLSGFSGVFAAKVEISKNKGFIVDGKPFFPIFAYNEPPDVLKYQKSFGVNIFIQDKEPKKRFTADKYLSAVKSAKAFAVIGYDWLKQSGKTDLLKSDQTIFACFLSNEPDAVKNGKQAVSAEELEKSRKEIKDINPNMPVWLNLSAGFMDEITTEKISPDEYKKLCGLADILSFSIYPANMWGENIDRVAMGEKKLRELSGNRVPVMPLTECTLISGMPEAGRAPLAEETKYVIWGSIINGAKGIGYLIEQEIALNGKYLNLNIETENALRVVHKLINDLVPVILSEDLQGKFEVISGGLDESSMLVKETPEYTYGFFMNPSKKPKRVKIEIKFEIKTTTVNIFDENRTLMLDKNKFIWDELKPRGMHIYEVPKGKKTLKPIITKKGQ